jgi:phospholipid transport system substrate-binding protein
MAAPALAQTAAPTSTQAALTDPAAKQVQTFYDALLKSMKNAKALGVSGRYKLLEPAVNASFDFTTMTKMIVGPDWDTMSPADRKSVADAFGRFTIANYAQNFDGYSGEQFIIDPNVQERSGDKVVSTKMTQQGKAPIPFLYRMDNASGSWKIIDVYLNGYVSEVATRRADFASTLKSGGASALTQKLKSMADKAMKGG